MYTSAVTLMKEDYGAVFSGGARGGDKIINHACNIYETIDIAGVCPRYKIAAFGEKETTTLRATIITAILRATELPPPGFIACDLSHLHAPCTKSAFIHGHLNRRYRYI